jgi:hypothetical protein
MTCSSDRRTRRGKERLGLGGGALEVALAREISLRPI